jgi:hypothetical protein
VDHQPGRAQPVFHGPEEIKELAAGYDPANALSWDETLNLAREMRYLDVRERNEQFLYPLSDDEVEAIHQELMNDAIEPIHVYSEAA